jgi:hypothetical protein
MDPRCSVLVFTIPKRLDTTTLNDSCFEQVQTLLNDVKFNEATVTMLRVGDRIEFIAMQPITGMTERVNPGKLRQCQMLTPTANGKGS